MELEPRYVDASVKRWEDYTGGQPAVSDGNLWDRQPGETAKAFHAFEHLRTLSALDRSIPAARAACRAQCGISPASSRQWHGWSTKYQWFNRAAEHDSDPCLSAPRAHGEGAGSGSGRCGGVD